MVWDEEEDMAMKGRKRERRENAPVVAVGNQEIRSKTNKLAVLAKETDADAVRGFGQVMGVSTAGGEIVEGTRAKDERVESSHYDLVNHLRPNELRQSMLHLVCCFVGKGDDAIRDEERRCGRTTEEKEEKSQLSPSFSPRVNRILRGQYSPLRRIA
jgi:hypothetical protein